LRVEDALSLPSERSSWDDAARSRLIPLDRMPLHLPVIALATPGDAFRFAAGGAVAVAGPQHQEASLVAVRDDGGRLLGVGDASLGTVRPRVVLPRKT
jgi:hypothetical protein